VDIIGRGIDSAELVVGDSCYPLLVRQPGDPDEPTVIRLDESVVVPSGGTFSVVMTENA
jgi:hypothetical protein